MKKRYITGALLFFVIMLLVGLVAFGILEHDKGWFGWGERPNDWRDNVVFWWFDV